MSTHVQNPAMPDINYVLDHNPEHDHGPTHSYPYDRRYRLSGVSPPQPGDIARCGHVKNNPADPSIVNTPPTCPRCRRLKGLSA